MQQPSMPRSLWFAVLAIFAGGQAAAQTTWYVDVNAVAPGNGTQAQPYTSIQYAVTRPTTVHDDTVLVAPGEYVENVSPGNKRLILRSIGGPAVTMIRAAQVANIVLLNADSTLEGFTVVGSSPSNFSGSVYARIGISTIRRCIVRDNANGCGILSTYEAFIENTTVVGNAIGVRAGNFGGLAEVSSSIVALNGTDFMVDGGAIGIGAQHGVYGAPDPGFWNYDARDLRLKPGSIAIDAGNPNAPPDPDGSITDAGALVYDPTYAPGPSSYCVGKLNSDGCTPSIAATGQASATSPAPFVVSALNEVPNKPGLLLVGTQAAAAPFQGGTLCLGSPIKRLGGQNSGGSAPCSGSFAFDMQGHIQSGTQPGLIPGVLVYCQWWNRDPLEPAGFGTGLSDALYFGIAP